ncbi:hypothetical protein RHMOL_Rhmol10G0179800 [Rhododendron molle]|uniref:Uncharacterized protein n=1 Tax=Rhododendron molle TaxID=49168 RepID=A0ACC0M598_RHOML|nr:hypothetical protein RHMOL_Rhmol10G0179800 [Rhododendron molle]
MLYASRNMLHEPWKGANAPTVALHVDDKNVNVQTISMTLAYLYGHQSKLNDRLIVMLFVCLLLLLFFTFKYLIRVGCTKAITSQSSIMNIAFQDMLAVSCPKFIGIEIVLRKNLSQQRGSNYYLLPADGNRVLVATSRPHNGKKLEYILDRNFIIRYCSMFRIGTRFRWRKYKQFEDWLNSFINNPPRFIQPHLRVMNLLDPPAGGLGSQRKQEVLLSTFCNFLQKIPEFFRPYLFAPPHGIALVYSGYHVYHVKIENHELAFGWNDVIAEHNFGSKYTLLLGSMGHLMFDLFIFDEKGYQIKYPWTTTALIRQPNAPIGWDSIATQCQVTNSTFFTSCLVTTFRKFGDELRFMKKLSHGDLLALELRASIKDFLNEIGLHRMWLTTGQSTWEVQYTDGFLIGQGWNNFIAAHNLKCYDTLVFSVDWELKMHIMVFDELGREKTYNWY